jgi:hypothetical protein
MVKPKAKAKPNAKPKGTKYAKGAKVGDFIHIKASYVSSHSQLKHWVGGQADDWWFTGKLEEIVTATENN